MCNSKITLNPYHVAIYIIFWKRALIEKKKIFKLIFKTKGLVQNYSNL